MRISEESLVFLGWPRIRGAWASECETDVARALVEAASRFEGFDEVERVFGLVGEMTSLEARGVRLGFGGVFDVRASLGLSVRGGIIDKAPMWELAQTLSCLRGVRRQLRSYGDDAPGLSQFADAMVDLELLASELAATFDAAGEIRDDASPELREARTRLTGLTVRTKERLERFLRAEGIVEYVQDDFYTQREARFVLPIVASFQHKVPGIIHGASNTGQTVYVEPTEFIEANNELALAHAAVLGAMRQILVDRTQWISEEADQIRAALASLIELDQLQARVRLGLRLGAAIPKIVRTGEVRLKDARNPALLLQGADVVPNDIFLGSEQSFVVLTGPNTGGKTVTLSTLGSLCLMVAAGLPIPADPDSVVPVFDGIYALGGDRQDIERSHSTFSGHMLAVKEILEAAGEDSLVLLDEIAVGTEPSQGAALAVAILESLVNGGARGFVTTHYERLKLLAYQDPAFANASVGVDLESQEPNYQLAFGASGTSSPFEVVERLGFAPTLVSRARSIISGSEDVSRALEGLREARIQLLQELEKAEAERARLAAELEEAQRVRARLELEAQDEVERLTAGARAEIEAALDQVRDQVRDIQAVGDAAELQRRRVRLRDLDDGLAARPSHVAETAKSEETPPEHAPLKLTELKAGTAVRVISMNRPGEIIDVRGEKEIVVSVGPLKITLPLGDLAAAPTPTGRPKERRQAKSRPHSPKKSLPDIIPDYESPPPRTDDITCDLRGMRRDEVADLVGAALDRAYLDQKEALWIIHGHGTGALKTEVRSILARSPYPRYSRPGLAHEGGDGVTIVWLDNR